MNIKVLIGSTKRYTIENHSNIEDTEERLFCYNSYNLKSMSCGECYLSHMLKVIDHTF